MELLQNYRNLVDKVDALCRGIETKYAEQISCRKGCDSCCRHISLSRVEAVNLAAALRLLPEKQASRILERARTAMPDGPCPLLEDGACALYSHRPIICRTHGLPIVTRERGEAMVDFCPMNFKGLESLPGNLVIDVDVLNTALTAINAVFVAGFFQGGKPEKERLTIAEALLSD